MPFRVSFGINRGKRIPFQVDIHNVTICSHSQKLLPSFSFFSLVWLALPTTLLLQKILWENKIVKRIRGFLYIEHPKIERFYLLPKVHKRLQNNPGRLVISNKGAMTENISAFLDYHLKQIILTIPHPLKDTRYLLCCIQNLEIPEYVVLLSLTR